MTNPEIHAAYRDEAATVPRPGGRSNICAIAVFNYPTLAEAYKAAALNGLNRL
jgi:hypothetical protein